MHVSQQGCRPPFFHSVQIASLILTDNLILNERRAIGNVHEMLQLHLVGVRSVLFLSFYFDNFDKYGFNLEI